MGFTKNMISIAAAIFIFILLQGCGGGTSSEGCCQIPKLADKVSETEKVVTVPETKGDQIVYVDRNVTVVEYVDRNITIIQYVDRNVTVEVIKVRPEAEISGLKDGAVLTDTELVLDGAMSSDIDGNVTNYLWVLDDENISTEKNTTITLPTEEGIHKLCLIVTDNDNLTSKESCKTFTIPHINENPTASISILNDKALKTKCPVLVSGSNSIANDGDIKSYIWTVDNNITLKGKDQNLSFDKIGSHKICLTVVDNNDLNDTQCNSIDIQDHDSPTPMLTMTDLQGNIISQDTNLTRGAKYNFSCKGSKDDCDNEEPMTCEWSAHSYRIDANGNKIDYVRDCIDHNGAPKVGENSWIKLCGSPITNYQYIELILKVTDQFNKTSTLTKIFEVAP
jgi:PKD repeat protein